MAEATSRSSNCMFQTVEIDQKNFQTQPTLNAIKRRQSFSDDGALGNNKSALVVTLLFPGYFSRSQRSVYLFPNFSLAYHFKACKYCLQ